MALLVVLEKQMHQMHLQLLSKQTSTGAHLLERGLMHLSVVEPLLTTTCWQGCILNPGEDEVGQFTGVNVWRHWRFDTWVFASLLHSPITSKMLCYIAHLGILSRKVLALYQGSGDSCTEFAFALAMTCLEHQFR